MPRYNPNEIEPRWQQYWDEHHTFATPEMPQGEKLYVLDMFPYPSGSGLHVGHPEGYTATDITCRFERMRGRSVLHPMGFDSFGLPAEEHAIKTNTHPRLQTEKNIETFRGQLKRLGFSYDWDRELATTDTDYFRWTQWIFLELFDTWFDHEQQKGRPIAELPIPPAVAAEGEEAVRRYQDEHRLAYQNYAPVNWCPTLGTVLANEEVIDGRSEVGGHPVERLPLRQWMLRITAYGDRLEKDLETLGWPDHVKALQRNWIGRSTGAEVDFFLGTGESHTPEKAAFAEWEKTRRAGGFPEKPSDDVLRVYTTRPDTLFGATYMVIAPEHALVERLTTAEQAQAVDNYCRKAAGKSDLERTELAKEKTGVFTGSYALNPVNGEPAPIWIADYVLATYGTGAIMAVPAHDERDFEFAKAYDIPVIAVVDPPDSAQTAELDYDALLAGDACFAGEGKAINSGEFNGLKTAEFKERITEQLTTGGTGKAAVNYKLRDWLFSRQRFWGEPFPLLHEVDENDEPTGLMRPVPLEQLPVDLPQVEDYKPHGRPDPLLEKAPQDWLYVELDGKRYKRETNTMPQWAGSCWYYLRFIDPKNNTAFVDPAKEQAWMPVDLYVGGVEHAVLHLLYARFWHKVLYDRGHVSTIEPFQKLVNQGMILGEMEFTGYQRENGEWVTATEIKRTSEGIDIAADGAPVSTVKLSPEELTKQGERFVLTSDPKVAIDSRAHKMSKSRGNVINPDVVVKEYGADSLRLYEMFMGPLEATKPWSMAGVSGVRNFLDRAWRLVVDDRAETLELHPGFTEAAPSDDDLRVLHKTIKAVTADTAALSCNTAIARMMELVNHFTKQETRPRAILEPFVLLLSPYAPHLCEELWHLLGHENSLAYESWPAYDEALTQDDTIEIPVQIKGKLRAKFTVPAGLNKDQLEAAAMADAKVQELLVDQQVVKTIVVPGRLVNFVTR